MQYVGRWVALGLLLIAPVVRGQNPPQPSPVPQPATPSTTPSATTGTTTTGATTPRPHHKSHKAQKELVLPPLPSGPLSQVPMEQIPASPARVSYQDGLLTIVAQNSTMGEVLRDVRKLTGAAIEIPPGAGASERIVVHLGPGAPRDVLAGLLNGSSFNYVMLGTSTDPTALGSVMLLAKTSASSPTPGETQTAANTASMPLPNTPPGMPPGRLPPTAFNRPGVMQRPGNAQAADAESDDSKDDDQDAADDNADDQAQPQPGQPDTSAQEQPTPTPTTAPSDINQPNAGPRTPEQIMQMLRNQPQPGTVIAPPPQPPQQ